MFDGIDPLHSQLPLTLQGLELVPERLRVLPQHPHVHDHPYICPYGEPVAGN